MTTAARLIAVGRRHSASLLMLPPVLLASAVYLPVIQNYFYNDDFLNLYHVANRPLLEYLITPTGGHLLVTRNAIFYATARLAGPDPLPFYVSAFVTHLVNVALLFGVVRRLTDSARLASVAAALWGISPFHEGTLGWYSVYGHAVVGTALLIILYQASADAVARRPPRRAQLVLWYALALAAATSFGIGTAVAIVLPAALRLWLAPAINDRPWWRGPLVSLVLVVPVLYVALYVTYNHVSGALTASPSPLLLLSNPLAMLRYLGHLTALGVTRLLLGPLPAEWMTPTIWYVGLGLVAAAAVAVAWRGDASVRRRLAACVLLLLACYGAVAVARALFLAEVAPAVLLRLTRYHYVGQLVATIMLALVANELAPAIPDRLRSLAVVIWYVAAIVALLQFRQAIDHHLAAREEADRVRAAILRQVAKAPPQSDVYITNVAFRSVPLPSSLFPGWAAVFVIFNPDNSAAGRRVYFVDARPTTLEPASQGIRTRTLIVPARPAVQ